MLEAPIGKLRKNRIHSIFDLGKDSTVAEKQKLEEQKQLLRNWYISQRLCEDNPAKLYWETMHHVHSFEGLGGDADTEKDELLPESFMGDLTQKLKEAGPIYLRAIIIGFFPEDH